MYEEKDKADNIRQVILSSLNENVSLLSSDPRENIDYLINRAYKLMRKIKRDNGNK